MSLDDDDTLAAVVRVPRDENDSEAPVTGHRESVESESAIQQEPGHTETEDSENQDE